jgi:DNA repair ATPase RecN
VSLVDRKQKRQIRLQINNLLEKCETCQIKVNYFKGGKRRDTNNAGNELNRYCNTECPSGIKMLELGKMLGSNDHPEIKNESVEEVRILAELTKELYKDLKSQGMSDKKICSTYAINHNRMNQLKTEWGFIGKFSKKYESKDNKVIAVEKHNNLSDDYVQLKKDYEELKALHIQNLAGQQKLLDKITELEEAKPTFNKQELTQIQEENRQIRIAFNTLKSALKVVL